jgi:uncharacterized NAD-dependent epimerase/dehydratase family protein
MHIPHKDLATASIEHSLAHQAILVCHDTRKCFQQGYLKLQGLAEYFSVCGEVTAVRLAGALGNRKAWIEFGTKESARSAREYDNTVSCAANKHCSCSIQLFKLYSLRE